MTIYFSASTGGFYDSGFHTPEHIPADAVEITDELHAALLEGQSNGKRIVAGANGPELADPPAPTDAELAASVRAERDIRINDVSWRYERNAREVRLGLTPTDELSALDAYVQALADVPLQGGFPAYVQWPVLTA